MSKVTLKSRFPEIAAELRPRVGLAIRDGARLIEDRAKAKVPVGVDPDPHPGYLFESIHVERRGVGAYAVVAGGEHQGTMVYWGRFVEFGTVKMEPQPFLLPAAEERKEEVAALVTGVLRGL